MAVFCPNDWACTGRILANLNELAEGHDNAAEFNLLATDKQSYSGGIHMVAGRVNHADGKAILEAVRQGARNPRWSTAFTQLAVLLHHELDMEGPRIPFA